MLAKIGHIGNIDSVMAEMLPLILNWPFRVQYSLLFLALFAAVCD